MPFSAWERVLDPGGSGEYYYWNSATDEVSWDEPPEYAASRAEQEYAATQAANVFASPPVSSASISYEDRYGPQAPPPPIPQAPSGYVDVNGNPHPHY